MKAARVFEHTRVLWVAPFCVTEHKLWMLDGPVIVLLKGMESSVKGDAVLWALQRSRQIPHPRDWNVPDPILLASGVKSWAAFEKRSHLVEIELDTELTLIPTRHAKGDSCFTDLREKALLLAPNASPIAIGDALDQALARCE